MKIKANVKPLTRLFGFKDLMPVIGEEIFNKLSNDKFLHLDKHATKTFFKYHVFVVDDIDMNDELETDHFYLMVIQDFVNNKLPDINMHKKQKWNEMINHFSNFELINSNKVFDLDIYIKKYDDKTHYSVSI